MKKKILLAVIMAAVIIKFPACEFGVEDNGSDPSINDVSISGQVAESATGDPVFNATVRITNGIAQVNVTTDANGRFSAKFSITQDQELTVVTFKEGYSTDTLKVFAVVGSTLTLPLIQLTGTGGSTSGGAASIYMYSQSSQSISVKESGTNETAQIIFEVLDSTGVPINSNNEIILYFSFGSSPGGGEFLYPASAQTNALGRASVTLNSGTKAGVLQIVAEMVVNGVVIKSRPVLIAIHGGLPVAENFYVAAPKLNYPANGIIGFVIPFTAYASDKYSNPVRPGTSVYFNTTSGIIEGSDQTDDLGRATVTLLTHPFPAHPVYGAGFFEVTASTIDENNATILTNTVRLLSGVPQISVNPSTFDIPNGGSQVFNYFVSDQNGNPLAEGTTISVNVNEGNLNVSGAIGFSLPDTQSPAYTSFSFTAYDSEPGTDDPQPAEIIIQVSGPNGNESFTISGTSR